MSIPFPIEDEEAARVVERASRGEHRHVLVLTERPILPESEASSPNGVAHEESELRALLADAISEAAAHDGIDGEPEWIPDPEPEPQEYELCGVGVIAEIAQFRPSGSRHVVLQGLARGIVTELVQQDPYLVARVVRQDDPVDSTAEAEAAMTAVERLRRLSVFIQKRLDVLNLRQQIQTEAQAGMDKQQREYYLREQLRAIQKELGESGTEAAVASELREKIDAAGMPEEVKAKALVQVERLEQQHPFSPEIGVIRGYLDWLIELPWAVETEDRLDLTEAARVLSEDHYGLEKVKERILEFIAVRKLAGDRLRAPILCFVGPPGVGKTSLGRSIARAIDRNYVRMSLGGVRDEAEIRGHRRTYVGAMPGRVIKALKDAKSRNPVMVLDEIDKVGSDAFRGDPSSALLEVLDPEQNTTFSDHYLEVPFDLSKVIFITTANLLEPIPPALRDRMEIIEVSGYTEVEKMAIGRQFLLPKTLETHGLTPEQLTVTDDALRRLIREYTEESGVRNLEREIGSLCRKVARILAGDDPPPEITVDGPQLSDYLGIPKYDYGLAEEQDEVGVATGAAVTSVGGDLLGIEVLIMPGKGDLILTGQLGDVMQESARAALSYARARTGDYGLAPDFFDRHNIHVHVPAGAIPKDGPSAGITMATALDGPSAGITMATALISALTGRQVRKDVAMTGEITLRGKVLPIGGLREKTVAAHRGGIKTFILPRRNAKDLAELPGVVRDGMELIQVDSLEQVLAAALLPKTRTGPVPVQVA
ncbi:MAG: ATP-dependent protease La [Thermomicrobiales bacterium]|nr:ATP-dependent protease La [Thermomicrobiales bacterium]